jgi:hypothetical protein
MLCTDVHEKLLSSDCPVSKDPAAHKESYIENMTSSSIIDDPSTGDSLLDWISAFQSSAADESHQVPRLQRLDEAHQIPRLQHLELELGSAALSGSTENDSVLMTPTSPSVSITFEEAKDEAYKSQISAFHKIPEQG